MHVSPPFKKNVVITKTTNEHEQNELGFVHVAVVMAE